MLSFVISIPLMTIAVYILVYFSSKKFLTMVVPSSSSATATLFTGNTTGSAPTMVDKLIHYGWPFPAVIGSTLMIAWGAELAEFFVSQGLALAILAWLQVMPEFVVEAALAKQAALNPVNMEFVTANFTGANRMLIGLGWPLVFFIAYFSSKRKMKVLQLNREHSVEVIGLLVPTLYFFVIWAKGRIDISDTIILFAMYGFYLYILSKLAPSEEEEHLVGVPAIVRRKSITFQKLFIVAMFGIGGTILFLSAEPFVETMKSEDPNYPGLGYLLNIPPYLMIQWIAPILSEFPELITCSYWARRVKTASTGLMNVISSKINQWTMLIGMIPVIFIVTLALAGQDIRNLEFNNVQRVEVLLTVAQSVFAVSLLLKLRLYLSEAAILFGLWVVQLVDHWLDPYLPQSLSFMGSGEIIKEWEILLYILLTVVFIIKYRKEMHIIKEFQLLWKKYISKIQDRK